MPDRKPGDFESALPDHQPWYRLVPSRYPPVQLWDRVASPDELHAVTIVEGITNARLAHEIGEFSLVPTHDWVFGTGASPIMAAYCHPNPTRSRFSDGKYGVYYAADSVETAIAEVSHHRVRWYTENHIKARADVFRGYVGTVVKPLVDIRAEPSPRVLHDPDSWSESEQFGIACRKANCWGIHYQSVRSPQAECVALLRPPSISPVIQGCHVHLVWDGRAIVANEVMQA